MLEPALISPLRKALRLNFGLTDARAGSDEASETCCTNFRVASFATLGKSGEAVSGLTDLSTSIPHGAPNSQAKFRKCGIAQSQKCGVTQSESVESVTPSLDSKWLGEGPCPAVGPVLRKALAPALTVPQTVAAPASRRQWGEAKRTWETSGREPPPPVRLSHRQWQLLLRGDRGEAKRTWET